MVAVVILNLSSIVDLEEEEELVHPRLVTLSVIRKCQNEVNVVADDVVLHRRRRRRRRVDPLQRRISDNQR